MRDHVVEISGIDTGEAERLAHGKRLYGHFAEFEEADFSAQDPVSFEIIDER